MGESSSSPRFRIRLEDGAELPINSVEALARRVAKGELDPETPLYDGSTGAWLKAADAPVVRFILEEMERDGVELPPGWELESQVDASVVDQEEAPAQTEPTDVAASEDATPGPEEEGDLLTLGLTLTPAYEPPVEGETAREERKEEEREEKEEVREAPEPPQRARTPRHPAKEWMTPRASGGMFTPTVSGDEPPAEADSAVLVPPADLSGADPRSSLRIVRREWMWLGGFVAAGVALVGMIMLVGVGQDADGDGDAGSGGTPSDVVGPETSLALDAEIATAAVPMPPGLEGEAQRGAELVAQRFQAVADSIAGVRGLAAAPPEAWLGGYYLANAAEFPDVPRFWDGYDRLVRELQVSDRALFLEALEDNLDDSIASPAELPALESYLRDRYEAVLPVRQELHGHLRSVAGAALDLHGFLVDRSEDIQFTPALGTGAVARDPVLEVGTQDPEVQRELELHLDELFQALDRSRGGGAPSPPGLRAELFGGFSIF